MKVLFIVPYVPNLIRVRPYNLIRHLARRGHEVTVLTIHTNDNEQADAIELSSYCQHVTSFHLPRLRSLANVVATLPKGAPLQSAYCWHPSLAREIGQLLTEENDPVDFDVVHVEHLRGAPYALHVKHVAQGCKRLKVLPVVWDSVDCISLLFRHAAQQSRSRPGRWMARLELNRTRRYEAWLVRQFDRILITSAHDRAALLRLCSREPATPPVSVLGNGVALDYFTPNDNDRDLENIVVSGKMSYHANVSMALFLVEEIMPRVWSRRPNTRVTIVGKDPPHSVLALADRPQVTVTGTVPDIRPYLRQATLAVAPVPYAAGIQNKVLEAMACATPVVATKQATASLAAVPNRDFLVADSAASFAQQILDLLENPAKRAAIGCAGRTYVEENHNWAAIAAQLETLYEKSIQKGG